MSSLFIYNHQWFSLQKFILPRHFSVSLPLALRSLQWGLDIERFETKFRIEGGLTWSSHYIPRWKRWYLPNKVGIAWWLCTITKEHNLQIFDHEIILNHSTNRLLSNIYNYHNYFYLTWHFKKRCIGNIVLSYQFYPNIKLLSLLIFWRRWPPFYLINVKHSMGKH